jgi:hypothetical protein
MILMQSLDGSPGSISAALEVELKAKIKAKTLEVVHVDADIDANVWVNLLTDKDNYDSYKPYSDAITARVNACVDTKIVLVGWR